MARGPLKPGRPTRDEDSVVRPGSHRDKQSSVEQMFNRPFTLRLESSELSRSLMSSHA